MSPRRTPTGARRQRATSFCRTGRASAEYRIAAEPRDRTPWVLACATRPAHQPEAARGAALNRRTVVSRLRVHLDVNARVQMKLPLADRDRLAQDLLQFLHDQMRLGVAGQVLEQDRKLIA